MSNISSDVLLAFVLQHWLLYRARNTKGIGTWTRRTKQKPAHLQHLTQPNRASSRCKESCSDKRFLRRKEKVMHRTKIGANIRLIVRGRKKKTDGYRAGKTNSCKRASFFDLTQPWSECKTVFPRKDGWLESWCQERQTIVDKALRRARVESLKVEGRE
jgi:hypothetical protein